MHLDHPPPRRPIEIIPLGEPDSAVAAAPRANGAVGAWPAPAVRTTVHPPVTVAPPEDLVIDLTAPAAPAQAPVAIDLTEVEGIDAAGTADTGPPAPASGLLVLGKRRERLRDLIARELESIEDTASVVPLHRPADDVAPFPLPGSARPMPAITNDPVTAPAPEGAPALRRVPKAARPDGAGRPLSDEIAAAIVRLGNTDATAAPSPAAPRVARRIEIVPLDDAPEAAVVPFPLGALSIDLRDAKPAATTGPVCPACAREATPDVVDRVSRVVHFSCRHCFRAWDEPLRQDG
jgi:hypothetical protein